MPYSDPLAAIDARIAMLRSRRAAAARFSEAYWEADDAISWLRVVRDEVTRSGRLREDVLSFLDAPLTAVVMERDTLNATSSLEAVPPIPASAPAASAQSPSSPAAHARRPETRSARENAEPVGAA